MAIFLTPGGGNPAGSDGDIQLNLVGAFGFVAGFRWVSGELQVPGDIVLDDGGSFSTTLQMVTATANRTISFPDATGTIALVAGSTGQLTYNNAGAQAGLTSASIGSTGEINISLAGADSTPPVKFTGSWFTGTAVTAKPQLLIEPSGTTSTGWSPNGTGLGVNAASGFSGNLIHAQTNGTSIVAVGSVGNTSTSYAIRIGGSLAFWSPYGGALAIGGVGGAPALSIEGALGTGFTSTALAWWTATPSSGAYSQRDIALARGAANVLKVTNGSTGDGTLQAQLRAVGTAPASSGATGTAGDIRYDADYIYVCTATDTWKRAALSTW